ncbi:hypothetical protein [Nocardioides marmoribigeumensis]|uniref:DUF4386 family protein n=1 Tax=Nocardioides marmoribigeumensis TaxID=433649 RepID=A0ABU2BV83_9ACTN|nr:hypothetical protein [Nocardioides marmoribigeumensis]MDR7361264.1 hypothetical protein [Nocardioides marmoribigeumensis]
MTQTRTTTRLDAPSGAGRRAWPLTAAAAGLCGVVATLVLDGRSAVGDDVSLAPQLFESLDPTVYRASMVVGYLAVVLLLVTAAHWRRHVEHRVPGSTAAHLVPLGLLASAAGLTYGYGWKGALGDYMPGGPEHGMYDDQGLYVYYLLNDFGAYIGWLGVVVSAGAVAWMAFRERTVSRWIGVVSVLPVLQTTLMVAGMGVPGVPALLGPLWLLVVGLGLSLGRSTVVR